LAWEQRKFDFADEDKNGYVSVEEYFALHAPDLSARAKEFQMLESAHYIEDLDTDKSGTLSLVEYKKVYTARPKRRTSSPT
jgi:Ca2+-binding EF-hand superfamily protein